jgi:hypothetical protein
MQALPGTEGAAKGKGLTDALPSNVGGGGNQGPNVGHR